MNSVIAFLMQSNGEIPSAAGAGVLGAVLMVWFAFLILFSLLMIVSGWKIFAKAGKPGWAVLVPIYNIIVLLEILRKPMSWFILALIPIVNLMLVFELAKKFGKGAGFAVGMIVLAPVFYPMLAFGDAQYNPNA